MPSHSSLRSTRQKISPLQAVMGISFAIGIVAIVVGALLPAELAPALMNDKMEHFLAYALLGLLGTWLFQSGRTTALLILSLCAFAVVLEFCQRFSPGRSTEIAEAAISCLGACFVPALRFLASLRLP